MVVIEERDPQRLMNACGPGTERTAVRCSKSRQQICSGRDLVRHRQIRLRSQARRHSHAGCQAQCRRGAMPNLRSGVISDSEVGSAADCYPRFQCGTVCGNAIASLTDCRRASGPDPSADGSTLIVAAECARGRKNPSTNLPSR